MTPTSPRPALSKRWRSASTAALLALALGVLPLSVNAADEGGTTTTTTPDSATTTTVPNSTTTTTPATTTTTLEPTTTTLAPTTSTTVPGSTTLPGESEPDGDEEPEDDELLDPPRITFPIVGRSTYRDTYGDPRDGGTRDHKGTDIFAEQGTPVVAVATGVVERMGETDDAGLYVVVRHTDGWRSAYVHLNNDSPGTDNGLTVGFGPGVEVGSRVRAGTLLGYVGDSGNSEDGTHHLHFELHQPDRLKINPYEPLTKARRLRTAQPLATVDYNDVITAGTELVGHLDPGTGFNAGVAALDDYLYLGTWGNGERCPGTGIRVVDIADPTEPEIVTSFADSIEFANTSTSALWVGNLRNDSFEGTIGVIGVHSCVDPRTSSLRPGFVGLAIYDLSEPTVPKRLSVVGSGLTTRGVESLDVVFDDGRVLVAATVPDSHEDTSGVLGSVRVVDVTDPANPRPLSDWEPPTLDVFPARLPIEAARIVAEPVSGITWVDPSTVVVSRESGELFVLDVSGSQPELTETVSWVSSDEIQSGLVGQSLGPHGTYLLTSYQPASNSASNPEGGRLLVVDADLHAQSKPAIVHSPTSEEDGIAANGLFAPGGSISAGVDRSVVAWMSGGIRVLDLSTPEEPVETASFLTAPAIDPQRWWLTPDGTDRFPMVWDVTESRGYFYAVDHHSGLWVFTIDEPPAQEGGRNDAN